LRQKLKNLFSFEFEADIWRMELDVAREQIALELRDGEALELSFSLIDLAEQQLRWEGLAFDSGWWTGLAGIHEGYVLFYTYEDQQNPELKNVFAVDAENKEVCWAYSGYNHLTFYAGCSLGFSKQDEERSYASIELSGGALRNLTDEKGLELLEAGRKESARRAAACVFPAYYSAENPYFSSVAAFIEKELKLVPVQSCEYLEIFDKIIISYYTANREKLSNFILVCDVEGEFLLHERLSEAGDGVAMDTFFVLGRKLIFTKEKRITECYEI
jgi:hypothetical protein